MSGLELLIKVGAVSLVGAYLFAAPGLVFLQRWRVISVSAWLIPLVTLALWWILYLVGLGNPEFYNFLEVFIVAGVVALGANIVALILAPSRTTAPHFSYMHWVLPLLFVVVLRLLMSPIGE